MKTDGKGSATVLGVIIFILVIVIAVILAWSLGYIHFGKQIESTDNTLNENLSEGSEYSQEITEKSNSESLKEAYKKYGFEWISKKKSTMTYVMTSTVRIEVNNQIQDVEFNYGEPLYSCPLPGQDFMGITVVTKDGKAYIGYFENGDFSKVTFTKVNISEKIIDVSMLGSDSSVAGPYYMSETGKVYDRDGNEYEEVNRNHIDSIGTAINIVYICEDNTIDIPASNGNVTEYVKVIDSNKKYVKAKQIFMDSLNDVFYIVTENNELVKINDMETGLVANVNSKTVSKVSYTEKNKHMVVNFTDGTKTIYDEIYVAYDLENSRHMQ